MKLKISTFILGIFMMSFSLNSSSTVHAQDTKDAGYLAMAVYYGVKTVIAVDSHCDDTNRKKRCKNQECGIQACISLRKLCSGESDCGGDEQPE